MRAVFRSEVPGLLTYIKEIGNYRSVTRWQHCAPDSSPKSHMFTRIARVRVIAMAASRVHKLWKFPVDFISLLLCVGSNQYLLQLWSKLTYYRWLVASLAQDICMFVWENGVVFLCDFRSRFCECLSSENFPSFFCVFLWWKLQFTFLRLLCICARVLWGCGECKIRTPHIEFWKIQPMLNNLFYQWIHG